MENKKYIIVAVILGVAAVVAYLLFSSTPANAATRTTAINPVTGLPQPGTGSSTSSNPQVGVSASSTNPTVSVAPAGSQTIDASSLGLGSVQIIRSLDPPYQIVAYVVNGVRVASDTAAFQEVNTKLKGLRFTGVAIK